MICPFEASTAWVRFPEERLEGIEKRCRPLGVIPVLSSLTGAFEILVGIAATVYSLALRIICSAAPFIPFMSKEKSAFWNSPKVIQECECLLYNSVTMIGLGIIDTIPFAGLGKYILSRLAEENRATKLIVLNLISGLAEENKATKLVVQDQPSRLAEENSATKLDVQDQPPRLAEENSATKLDVQDQPSGLAEENSATKLDVQDQPPRLAEENSATKLEVQTELSKVRKDFTEKLESLTAKLEQQRKNVNRRLRGLQRDVTYLG